ncbi:MAG: hypothetical protein ACJ8F7_17290 [Gemmataceae bacterium]
MPSDAVSLPDQATQLRLAVERLRRRRDAGGTIDALNRTAAEGRVIADLARPLATARTLVPANLAVERLAVFRDQLADAATRAAADPDALAQPSVDFASLRRTLESARETLLLSWKQYVQGPVEGEALVPVLERFAPFRSAVEQFRLARAKLQPLSEQLPPDEPTLASVRQLRAELHAALKSVDAAGLDAEAADFLRRCLDGYPLADLLARPELLAWLQGQGLLASLRVRPV